MAKHTNKFESQVHSGFLLIVCLLLLLNFVSNFMIFRAARNDRAEGAYHLRSAAISISRAVQESYPENLSNQRTNELKSQFRLTGLVILPTQPTDLTPEKKRTWLASLVRHLPLNDIPDLAGKLMNSDFQDLSRGIDSEYSLVYPLSSVAGRRLIVLSADMPDLAYMDDARKLLSWLLPISVIIVVLIYLLLSRRIFSPFRKIKEEAARVGRLVPDELDDAEAVVHEYRNLIERLREKESELLRLNAHIQSRADSLEQLNQYLLQSSDSGIITLSPNGLVLSLNSAARDIFEISHESVNGAPYSDLFGHYSELCEIIESTRNDKSSGRFHELEISRKSKGSMNLGVSISPIWDQEGFRVGTSLLIADLTEVVVLRRNLEQSHRLSDLGEMAAGLAHQLRNSMGAIGGYSRLIKKKLISQNMPSQQIDSLMAETTEAENLISKFLKFSRPLDYTPEIVNLSELIGSVVSSFRVRNENDKTEFSIDVDNDLDVIADSALLRQAIANLVDNAVQSYIGRVALVEIKVSSVDGDIEIKISDHGSGIPLDEQEKIFTPFFSSRPSGTGLGLPLVKKIIDLHSGCLTLESELERGTCFTISLPKQADTKFTSTEKADETADIK